MVSACHIGVDLGGTKTEVVALDGDGTVHYSERRPSPRDDYDATLDCIAALVAAAEDRVGTVSSIGIGTPGSEVPGTGLMQNCNSTWLNGRPLQADLCRRLDRAVTLANDANCFALSEAVDGAGADAACVFGVILGTGVGGGIVLDGRLHRGANGIAGEWGYLPLPPLQGAPAAVRAQADALGARRCWCGRCDCIETWLSGPGLARSHHLLAGRSGDDADARDAQAVLVAAARGDAAASSAVALHAWQLSAALAIIVDVLDPQVIVLGGGLSKVSSLYTEVPARWTPFLFAERVQTRLVPPRYGDASGVRGAAWLAAGRVR
jgi:fructokinase